MYEEMEFLNYKLIQDWIIQRGCTMAWVSMRVGLEKQRGYEMLRKGVLPWELKKRKKVVALLADLTGIEEARLVLKFGYQR